MKASELARATAEFFTDHPWGQGRNYYAPDASYCMRGALMQVQLGNTYPCPAAYDDPVYMAIDAAVRRRTIGAAGIVHYNDGIASSVDEIVHMLKFVAEDLELEGL